MTNTCTCDQGPVLWIAMGQRSQHTSCLGWCQHTYGEHMYIQELSKYTNAHSAIGTYGVGLIKKNLEG